MEGGGNSEKIGGLAVIDDQEKEKQPPAVKIEKGGGLDENGVGGLALMEDEAVKGASQSPEDTADAQTALDMVLNTEVEEIPVELLKKLSYEDLRRLNIVTDPKKRERVDKALDLIESGLAKMQEEAERTGDKMPDRINMTEYETLGQRLDRLEGRTGR